MELGWLMVWTFSYRLTHGNGFTYAYLITQEPIWDKLHGLLVLANTLAPGLEGPEGPETLDIIVNALVFGFVLAGIGYLAAILLVDLGITSFRGAAIAVVAIELVFQITLFLMPGVYTTDISSYVMYGHISAVYNLNPYIYPPQYFPNNPLLNPDWIHPIWWDQPSVYGPLWTDIGWVVAKLLAPWAELTQTQPDGLVLQIGLMDQIFAYRLLMNVIQLANVLLVWWILGRLMADRPRARLTALVVFAWNPLMLFDAAGNAHNDALMVTLLLLGIVPLVVSRQEANRAWFVGTFCVGMSALIKYTTALVGVFYIVPWARRLESWRARLVWIGGALAAIAVATFVLYIPWLDVPRMFGPILTAASGKSWMYSNWAPDLVALTIDRFLDPASADDIFAQHETVRFWAKAVTRGVFVVYLGWELLRLWRLAGDRSRSLVEPVLEASARAFVVLILWVLTWVLEWYWMWPLALVSLLGWHRLLTKVVVGYTLTSLPIFYVHHYWSTNMPGVLVLAYALPPLAVPLIAWGWDRWRPTRRSDPAVRRQPAVSGGLERVGVGSE
jgi:Glycosyltransferase family 87